VNRGIRQEPGVVGSKVFSSDAHLAFGRVFMATNCVEPQRLHTSCPRRFFCDAFKHHLYFSITTRRAAILKSRARSVARADCGWGRSYNLTNERPWVK
jgi:hypothetical protein